MNNFLQKIEAARLEYKPDHVKYLLIAEAPPDSLGRFFYWPEVFTQDSLFLGVSNVLYPNLKEKHLSFRRRRQSLIKKLILNQFKKEGFFLLDLSDEPVSIMTKDWNQCAVELEEKIKKVLKPETKIFLIKANVYDLLFQRLNIKFPEHVIDERIPFPGSGNQRRFYSSFSKALQKAGALSNE